MSSSQRHTRLKKPLIAASATVAVSCASFLGARTTQAQVVQPPVASGVLQAQPQKPNVIVIVADDLGYNDLSIQGSRDIRTPNIDSLAQNGTRFTNGYVSAPQCAPTRAGLLTGRYQQRFGFEFNAIRTSNNGGLPLDQLTIANHLKNAGYVTGLVGKWHLGSLPEQRPQRRGFDEFFGFLGGANPYLSPALAAELGQRNGGPEGKAAKRRAAANGAAATGAAAAIVPNNPADADERAERRAARLAQRVQGGGGDDEGPAPGTRRQAPDVVPNILRGDVPVAERGYLTDAFGREASAFIERHKGEPFYLQLTSNAPHGPQQATRKYLDRFPNIQDPTRRTYAAQVSALDDAIGNVLQTLRATEQENNTLIFFFSDNGGPLGDKWNGSNNDPLSGNKGDVLEGGIRVPFFVQWKGHIPAGRVDNRPIIQLDVLPTALAAAGAPVPSTQAPDSKTPEGIDGVNLLPFLEGKNAGNPHDVLFWRFNRGRTPDQFQWAIRQGDTKLLQPRQSPPRLVNLAADLKENNDLSTSHAAQSRALQAQWTRWNAQLQEPAWQIGAAAKERKAQAGAGASPSSAVATDTETSTTAGRGRPRRNEGKARDGQPRSAEREAKRAQRRAAREKNGTVTAPAQQ
jgi:arylsulfatase A-like enzyme